METTLKLEISASKDRYQVGEEILVKVYLFNLNDDPITVNTRLGINRPDFPGEISFKVIDPSGNPIAFMARVNIGTPESEHFSTIIPGNFIGKEYDLDFYFPFDDLGQYSITATYQNKWSGDHVGLEAWVGTLPSNTISLHVE